MKRSILIVLCCLIIAPVFAGDNTNLIHPTIFIRPATSSTDDNESLAGFETFITAAFTKKETPAYVVTEEENAEYALESVIISKEESTGGKIARCLFAYCAGMEGKNTASVRLIRLSDNAVIWAYNVKKGGAKNFQSSSEAIAKHLGKFIKKNQQLFMK